jgi:hypothetical protein
MSGEECENWRCGGRWRLKEIGKWGGWNERMASGNISGRVVGCLEFEVWRGLFCFVNTSSDGKVKVNVSERCPLSGEKVIEKF